MHTKYNGMDVAVLTELYSIIYLNLREKGTPIPANDIWPAVFTKDDHFSDIDGRIVKDFNGIDLKKTNRAMIN